MKTSQEWWNEVKTDSAKFNEWLKKQYYGELTAADRIEAYSHMAANPKDIKTLVVIAGQERKHAEWVATLLQSRGIDLKMTLVEMSKKDTPYWDETLGQIESFTSAAAVAALAEKMRLERIKTIMTDQTAPADVRKVFSDIYGEELFHERAFRQMSNPEAIQSALAAHEAGVEALGLIMPNEVL